MFEKNTHVQIIILMLSMKLYKLSYGTMQSLKEINPMPESLGGKKEITSLNFQNLDTPPKYLKLRRITVTRLVGM